MEKVFVFLGKKDGDTYESFRARYLGEHKEKILAAGVSRYYANTCESPSEELLKAGWGVYSADDNVFEAYDVVWTDNVEKLLAQYDDENMICAYRAEEYSVKKCMVDTPAGESNFWIKRVTIIKRRDGMTMDEFVEYWQNTHGPKAKEHLIGLGIYYQNYVREVLVGRDFEWDGVTELYYWDENAFKYGHFSQPDSRQVLSEDNANFVSKGMTLLFKEYVQKA